MIDQSTNSASNGIVVIEAGRAHFGALDGLRGVAALMVVLFHQSSVLLGGKYLQHAYLAVDFFFILSGFVISYAYSQRLSRGMSVQRFVVERGIRLLPLLTLGALIGALYLLIAQAGWTLSSRRLSILCKLPFAIMAVPYPFKYLSKSIFELNAPEWSLFFEIIANIMFVCGLHRISLHRLYWITAVLIAMRITIDFTVAVPFWDHESVLSCFSATLQVTSSFCLGMVMERANVAERHYYALNLPIYVLPIVLTLLLSVPFIGRFDVILKTAIIYFAFPVVILFALRACMSFKSARVASLSGAISYPLYILHGPILSWDYYTTERLGLTYLPAWMKIAFATTMCCAIAWCADQFFDVPLRKMLRQKLLLNRTVNVGQ